MAKSRPTLYTGVTSFFIQRIYQHKNNLIKGFTSQYNLHKLVYFENCESIMQVIVREKQIKGINRQDKIMMIKEFNPLFDDLYDKIIN